MTPLAGSILGTVAGLLVRPPRRAMIAATPPWLAVLAVQTWHLATGHGHNPASTISNPGYWLVQLITLALALGVAAGVSAWRARRVSDPRGGSPNTARVGVLSAIATVMSVAVSLPLVILTGSGSGKGSAAIPLTGIVGDIACLLALVVLGIVEVRARRDRGPERGARLAPGDAR